MEVQLIQSILHRLGEKLPLSDSDDSIADFKSDALIKQNISTIIAIAPFKLSIVSKCLVNLIDNLPVSASFSRLFLLKFLLKCLLTSNYSSPTVSNSTNIDLNYGQYDSGRKINSISQSNNNLAPIQILSSPHTLNENIVSIIYSLAIRILASIDPPSDLQNFDSFTVSPTFDLLKTVYSPFELYCTAGRLLFVISSSNWDFVFAKMKAKLYNLSQISDENVDLAELRALEWVNMNSKKLSLFFQEMGFLIKSYKKNVVFALPSILRRAIWNWIILNPQEFVALHNNQKRLDGVSDLLFEHYNELADNQKKKSIILPFQTALLTLCPDVLSNIVSTNFDLTSSNKKIFPFAFFMENLRANLRGKHPEIAAICFVDFCKAGVVISKGESSLKKIVADIDQELREKLFSPQKPFLNSEGVIDTKLMIDFFIASFRRNPELFIKNNLSIFTAATEGVPVVFRCVLAKACLNIASQATNIDTSPSLLAPHVAVTLRQFFHDLVEKHVSTDSKRNLSKSKSKKEEDSIDRADLLVTLLKLFRIDPSYAIWNDILEKKVTENRRLMTEISGCLQWNQPIYSAAADALLELLKSKVILQWGPPTQTSYAFWTIFSQVVSSVAAYLSEPNKSDAAVRDLLEIFFKMLVRRNEFIRESEDKSGSILEMTDRSMSNSRVESAILISLCSNDTENCILAMHCLREYCAESLLVNENEDEPHLQNIKIYRQLLEDIIGNKGKSNLKMTGRVALQKRIRRTLRNLEYASDGVVRAWDEGYRRWTTFSPHLKAYEEGGNLEVPDVKKKSQFFPQVRSSSHLVLKNSNTIQPPQETSFDDKGEWQNYAGFLCSLGGCCMPNSPEKRSKKVDDTLSLSQILMSPVSDSADILKNQLENNITKFIAEIFEMLVCDNAVIREAVKELVGSELSPGLFSLLFKHMEFIKTICGSDGEVICSDRSTFHVEQAISVLKLILERTIDRFEEVYSVDFGALLLSYVKYLNKLGRGPLALMIKVKMCYLVDTVMTKRDQINLREEIRFRNRLLETFVEWTSDFSTIDYSAEDQNHRNVKLAKDLDTACLKAMVRLLDHLPLQPTDLSAEINVTEARTRLFSKYLQFFIALLRRCRIESSDSSKEMAALKEHSIAAFSNLLSSNIDCGLKYAISVGYHEDPKTRTAFMQVLTNILNQGTEFDGLIGNDSNDTLEKLADYLYDPDLSLTCSLCEVCDSSDIDPLGSLLFTIFEARNQTLRLLQALIDNECKKAESAATLFRRNSVATKLMTLYAKSDSGDYLRSLFNPLWQEISTVNTSKTFEIDPMKIAPGENISTNNENLKWLSKKFLDSILQHADEIPASIRNICAFLVNSVSTKFPEANLSVLVGGFVFLRLFCPAIVSPESLDFTLSKEVRRGLVLVTKIIQNISNNVLFGGKESFMKDLNDFLESNNAAVHGYLKKLTESSLPIVNTVLQNQRIAIPDLRLLHRLMYDYIENMTRDLTSKTVPAIIIQNQNSPVASENVQESLIIAAKNARIKVDELRLYLDQLGPPLKIFKTDYNLATFKGPANQLYVNFMHKNEGRKIEDLKEFRIFYEGGLSKHRRQVFYFIARKITRNVMDMEAVIYLILLVIKPYQGKPFDVVMDLSLFSEENVIDNEWITLFIQVLPNDAVNNLTNIFVFNANSEFKKFAKRSQKFLSNKMAKKILFLNSMNEFNEHISPIDLRLPKSTLQFEQDVTMFQHISRNMNFRQSFPVLFKLNNEYLQITSVKKADIIGFNAVLNDIYSLTEIDDAIISVDRGSTEDFSIKFSSGQVIMQFSSTKREQIVNSILAARTKALQLKPSRQERVIRPNDVPGTLLNMALLNMAGDDADLRQTSYCLLSSLCLIFNFDAGLQLISSKGLYVPENNSSFISLVSSRLAKNAGHLTFEFLKEFLVGFEKSDLRMKNCSLEYVYPWLMNLSKPELVVKKGVDYAKEIQTILESLVDLTIKDTELEPAVQKYIWITVGKQVDLLDIIIEIFVRKASSSGPSSMETEILAGTCVTLASVNLHTVAAKIVTRLRSTIKLTGTKNLISVAEHSLWPQIAVLVRFSLMLSFNNQLNVQELFPELLHIISMLLATGPAFVRSSVHALAINVIHSVCTSSSLLEQQMKQLNLISHEYSGPKYRLLFGTYRSESVGEAKDIVPLFSLETVVKSFLEIVNLSSSDNEIISSRKARWMSLATEASFQFNPALQPRAFIQLGCLSWGELDEDLIFQVLSSLKKSLLLFDDQECTLAVSVIMSLTNMIEGSREDSRSLRLLFWLAVSLIQIGHIPIYHVAVNMLQVILRNLNMKNLFLQESPSSFFTRYRQGIEKELTAIESMTGVSFSLDFPFALGTILMKGLRNPATKASTVSLLALLLDLTNKYIFQSLYTPRDADATLFTPKPRGYVDLKMIGYLAPLMPVLTFAELKDLLWTLGVSIETQESQSYFGNLSSVWPLPTSFETDKAFGLRYVEILETVDEKTSSLLVCMMISCLENAEHERELIFLYNILSEFSVTFPDIMNLKYPRILPRLLHAASNSHEPQVLDAIQKILIRLASTNPELSDVPLPPDGMTPKNANASSSPASSISDKLHIESVSSGLSHLTRSLTLKSQKKRDRMPSPLNMSTVGPSCGGITSNSPRQTTPTAIQMLSNCEFPALQGPSCGSFEAVARSTKYSVASLVAQLIDAILQ